VFRVRRVITITAVALNKFSIVWFACGNRPLKLSVDRSKKAAFRLTIFTSNLVSGEHEPVSAVEDPEIRILKID
jgi:hypothetical protein